ncbi:putative D-tagatose-1,6-bisphosphate aldolase subunit kbaZ [Octadecabacter antarcticus 307]|uniref:Putative D-tagatose-1,6-bisphosphate aldolase subunit kbaZ n=1 Tax=Octadecabacter antarcticus 307 TaxID=391626 RepID=M9RAM6_9RHOB|nr:class II D-tagatose-bisphosphate aldolase, non-catalytic subunit [Octadecabacter antarcticus]AGI69704.1 putative D-tagatose-1,6-bisphosphate aldolase subunit kbaZ [Octadecabacter antarcticus 307]
MSEVLRDIIKRNRAGQAVAIPSVCSAQADVILASLLRAQTLDRAIVIEATSNQVNQFGGYTGMRPSDFMAFVRGIAKAADVDLDRIQFGGDHLGPQVWRDESSDSAMAKAHELVTDYVRAGFTKIHLDCSEGCVSELAQLDDEITSARSAELARTCVNLADDLMFIVGTEVPPPGGARTDECGDIAATSPDAASATLALHMDKFGEIAALIGGLVVQPGVEFSPVQIHHLPMAKDPKLIQSIADWPSVCLEAHSTDYQHPQVFPRLAQLGFAFQKVGPALTLAYRQALYSLDIVRSLSSRGERHLSAALETAMLDDPRYWQSHYQGDAEQLLQQRHFGLADRIRYYWPVPSVQAAVQQLVVDLPRQIPDPILWQVFGQPVLDRAEDLAGSQIERLVRAQIQIALDPYFFDPSTGGTQ